MSLGDLLADGAARRAGEAVAAALIGAVVREAAERIGPDKAAAARVVADAVLDHIPVDLLREALTEAATRRANAAADLAEDAKHGPSFEDPP
jgi:hypothetical protein